jgi:hypothetical protein
MTDEEVKLTREASRLAARCLSGDKLTEGLKIGASLLVGRNAAMKAAGADTPQGKAYAEAFYDWKRAFKFPEGPAAEALYDAAIIVTQHPCLAEQIIGGLSAKRRAEMGVFGLAKRVRTKLREFDGKPKKARKARASREAEFEGRLADMEERQMSEEPLKYWRRSPEDMGRAMAREDSAAFRRLAAAGLALLDGPLLLENNSER